MVKRIGFHIIAQYEDAAYNARIGAMKPSLLTYVCGTNELGKVKAMRDLTGSDTTYVVRIKPFEDAATAAYRNGADPIAAARTWADATALLAKDNRIEFAYFQGLNEQKGNYEWQAAFDVARIKFLMTHGIRCAIGAFARGNPEPADWLLYSPALDAVLAYSGLLALHEYAYGGSMLKDEGWQVGRWALLPNPYRSAIPIAITEYGYDNGNETGFAMTGRSSEYYVADMVTAKEKWYDPYPNVIGCSVYTLDNSEWGTTKGFHAGGAIFNAIEKYNATVSLAPAPAPSPAPPPPSTAPTETGELEVLGQLYHVKAGVSLRQRIGPGLDQPIMSVLPSGTPVMVKAFEGDWAVVQSYVHKDYIK